MLSICLHFLASQGFVPSSLLALQGKKEQGIDSFEGSDEEQPQVRPQATMTPTHYLLHPPASRPTPKMLLPPAFPLGGFDFIWFHLIFLIQQLPLCGLMVDHQSFSWKHWCIGYCLGWGEGERRGTWRRSPQSFWAHLTTGWKAQHQILLDQYQRFQNCNLWPSYMVLIILEHGSYIVGVKPCRPHWQVGCIALGAWDWFSFPFEKFFGYFINSQM